MTPSPARNLVLIGLMGAGKSTVGVRVADRMGWRFVDLDEVVERRTGLSVAEVFDRFGEPAFRTEEREAADEVLASTHVVLAAGGGWAIQPSSLESLHPNTLSVWLRVSPEEAVRRIMVSGRMRPLLNAGDEEGDPVEMLKIARSLAMARDKRYALADLEVDAEAFDVDHLAESIVRWTEQRG